MMHFQLPTSQVNREEFILSVCSGQRVLHLGCADAPFTDESIATGRWLHSNLSKVSAECIGVDIDSGMVSHLRNKHHVENIVEGDAETLETLGCGLFDVVLAGEIIEHLKNPGNFLRSAKTVLAPHGRLLITTTNAFCFRRMIRIPFHSESIHPDHNFYFSHTTLRHLVVSSGYVCLEQHNYRVPGMRPFIPNFTEYLATRISANLGEGIIMLCRPSLG